MIGRRRRGAIGVTFGLVCLAYLISFGVRTVYLLARPDLVTFPNFVTRHDLRYVHEGLLWAAGGLYAMTLSYFALRGRVRATVGSHATEGRGSLGQRILGQTSPFGFILVIYGIGTIGRIAAIRAGSNLYLYNSPAFDQFATRQGSGSLVDIVSALADLCTISFAAMLALYVTSRPRRSLYLVLSIAIALGEVIYYSLGLYKYGLFSLVVIPVVVLWAGGAHRSVVILGFLGVIYVLLLFPILNQARVTLYDFNRQTTRGPSSQWFDLFSSGARQGSQSVSLGQSRSYLDPFFERLNGPEALAVATKNPSGDRLALGRTYLNIPRFLPPSPLRFWSSRPYYIPWETDFVGYPQSSFLVVPMPAIVEAYLNGGVIGVAIGMALFGAVFAGFDGLLGRATHSPVALGAYAYVAWKLINIEQNAFIVVIPTLKVLVLLAVLSWLYRLFSRSLSPVPKREALPIGPLPST
jgi:hypothetical protein